MGVYKALDAVSNSPATLPHHTWELPGVRDQGPLCHDLPPGPEASGQSCSPGSTWPPCLGSQPPVTHPAQMQGHEGSLEGFLECRVCQSSQITQVMRLQLPGCTLGQRLHRGTQEALEGLPWSPQMPSPLGPEYHVAF